MLFLTFWQQTGHAFAQTLDNPTWVSAAVAPSITTTDVSRPQGQVAMATLSTATDATFMANSAGVLTSTGAANAPYAIVGSLSTSEFNAINANVASTTLQNNSASSAAWAMYVIVLAVTALLTLLLFQTAATISSRVRSIRSSPSTQKWRMSKRFGAPTFGSTTLGLSTTTI